MLVAGTALLGASLGQVGYMLVRQHQLRRAAPGPGRPLSQAAGNPSGPLRLVIPSIGLDDAVVRGTSYTDLLAAPGLLEGSPLPSAGGNTVIAGHRDTFFRHVSDLRPGASIVLWQGDHDYQYRVASRDVISPALTSVLANTYPSRLTLVTCYPTYWIGPAPNRLIVVATRVARQP